jgi:small-conductance mechanosensitive channel
VFSILIARGGKGAEERASAASAALAHAVDDGAAAQVRVEQLENTVSVFAGKHLIIEIGPEDAIAAGEPSLQAYAASVAARVREALDREQSRSVALLSLLSLALVVLCAVMGLFLIRKVGDFADRMRTWISEHPDRLPALKLQSIEVIRPKSFRAALLIGLGAGKALAQIGIVYGWVLISLSLFESTRGYAERLTGFVFGPLYSILARLVGSLPLLVVAAIAAIAMMVLIRFVGLFFDGVVRGDTTLDWLPADLAAPTSVLFRVTIALVFFVIAAPLVTGDDGALARAGTVAVVALGLSTTPMLACVAVGVTVVYGRGLKVGDFAEVGGRVGRVSAITLLDIRLDDEHGSEIRVPHLLGLIHPTRVLGPHQRVSVEVVLAPKVAADDKVGDLLRDSAGMIGKAPEVEVVALDADGVRYRVTVSSDALDAKRRLYAIVAQALVAADVPLGRPRSGYAS